MPSPRSARVAALLLGLVALAGWDPSRPASRKGKSRFFFERRIPKARSRTRRNWVGHGLPRNSAADLRMRGKDGIRFPGPFTGGKTVLSSSARCVPAGSSLPDESSRLVFLREERFSTPLPQRPWTRGSLTQLAIGSALFFPSGTFWCPDPGSHGEKPRE